MNTPIRQGLLRYRPAAIALALLASGGTADADTWSMVVIGTPPGALSSSPRAINNDGVIVGEFFDSQFVNRAFVYRDGLWTTLGSFGGRSTRALGINERGQVVGSSTLSSNNETHAFLWDGSMHDLGTAGFDSVAQGISNSGLIVGGAWAPTGFAASWQRGQRELYCGFDACRGSSAFGVNSRGQIVGRAITLAGSSAYLWDPVTGPQDLGTLGGPHAWAVAISEVGNVVGYSYSSKIIECQTFSFGTICRHEEHPFLWTGGEMLDLGTFGGPHGSARGVNSAGEVAGGADTAELLSCHLEGGFNYCVYGHHAFVWSEGELVDLGVPGKRSFATGINENGDVVGWAEGAGVVVWQRQTD